MFGIRVTKIKQVMDENKLEGILISSISNIAYLTGYSNFSDKEREAYLVITKEEQFIAKQKASCFIITDGRYKEAIIKEVPHFELLERSSKNPLKSIFSKISQKIKTLGIEENDLTIAEYKLIKKNFKKLKHLSTITYRSIKTAEEIEKIKAACKLGDLAFKQILKKITKGITEKELAFEIDFFIKKSGANLSFPTIVAFGKNSSVPHHQAGNTKLENNQFVLFDMGVKLEDYCSDMTRTVFFGKPDEKQKKIYQTVLEAQRKAAEFVKAGVKAAEVDKIARKYITSKGYPSIPHSLGHGIGLEVHEHPSLSPKSKDILKEGMVFSIEPGIYLPAGRQGIPGFGSPRSTRLATKRTRVEAGGVRIEDLYILEKKGLRQITTSPKSLIKI